MKIYVLLIDSNEEFRAQTTALLRDRGFAVFGASTIGAAEQILDREAIDLICVDACVSGKTGLDLLRRLRRRGDYLLVFVSNPDRPFEMEAMGKEDIAINMLLHRPLSPEEVAYKIDVLVRLKTANDDPAPFPGLPPNTAVEDFSESRKEVELSASYADRIPTMFAEIGSLLTGLARGGSGSDEGLGEARRIAHKLTGTAGTMGFSEVSSVAHVIETRLKDTLRMKQLASTPVAPPVASVRTPVRDRRLVSKGENATMARVLVLDDDETFLERVVSMGRENLIRVYPATNGEEALALAKSRQLDAAVLDVMLAKNDDPFDIAKRLRAMPEQSALSLGFISTAPSLSTRIAAVHAGASVFLDKPLDNETFTSAIRRLVPIKEVAKPKVLIVDDDEDFLAHLANVLSAEEIEPVTLTHATTILKDIERINPDMLLLDVFLEKINGLDVCRVLRSSSRWQDLPILVLTVYGNRETLVECYAAGADDYIEKPVIKEELMARINLRLDRTKMFKERADVDVLTGLPTRRPFLEMLKMRLSESGRFNKPLSLCLLDLDHFKAVNDTYGHLAGDRVLASVGQLLKNRFRIMDVRGRWGGEEFVVAFYGEEEDTAKMIINRALDELRNMTFQADTGALFKVTFSAGVASYPRAGQTIEELFRKVDENLYRAKDLGRNRIET